MSSWDIIKLTGAVMAAPAQGGKGNPATDALFNTSFGHDCDCGKNCTCGNNCTCRKGECNCQ